MSDTFPRIQALVRNGEVRISEHGYDQMAEDGLSAREVLAGIGEALVVEDYPNYYKGQSVLVLQRDRTGSPIHVVWDTRRVGQHPLFSSRHTVRTLNAGQPIS